MLTLSINKKGLGRRELPALRSQHHAEAATHQHAVLLPPTLPAGSLPLLLMSFQYRYFSFLTPHATSSIGALLLQLKAVVMLCRIPNTS